MFEALEVAVAMIGLLASAGYAWWLDSPTGREIAARKTWVTVVIGVGLTLILAAVIVPFEVWIRVALLFVATGAPIVVRSLRNELRAERQAKEIMRDGDAS